MARIFTDQKKTHRNLRLSTVESLIPAFLGSSSSFFPIGCGFAALGSSVVLNFGGSEFPAKIFPSNVSFRGWSDGANLRRWRDRHGLDGSGP